MRNNIRAACGKRQFEYHVVVSIGKERPPQEMDLLDLGLAGEITKKPERVVFGRAWRQVLCESIPLAIRRKELPRETVEIAH